ncbi:MAG: thiol-disulfide oxidoreductase DCC family protein [Pseudomonadales bacterium]
MAEKEHRHVPFVSAADKVILFDGVCKLCHAWAGFIITRDTQGIFKFCSVQSPQGASILAHFDFPLEDYGTMLYVKNGHFYQKSDAFFEVMRDFGFPWRGLCLFQYTPRAVRDWLYDSVARNRYKVFGKYSHCLLPTADHKERFIDDN